MYNKKRWIVLLLSILAGSIVFGILTHEYLKGVIFCILVAVVTNATNILAKRNKE